MARVIGAVVAGRRVGENGETGAIDREPGRDLAKPVGRHRQLHAAARERTHRAEMAMADHHPETLTCRLAERALGLMRVETDMGVEITDGVDEIRHGAGSLG